MKLRRLLLCAVLWPMAVASPASTDPVGPGDPRASPDESIIPIAVAPPVGWPMRCTVQVENDLLEGNQLQALSCRSQLPTGPQMTIDSETGVPADSFFLVTDIHYGFYNGCFWSRIFLAVARMRVGEPDPVHFATYHDDSGGAGWAAGTKVVSSRAPILVLQEGEHLAAFMNQTPCGGVSQSLILAVMGYLTKHPERFRY